MTVFARQSQNIGVGSSAKFTQHSPKDYEEQFANGNKKLQENMKKIDAMKEDLIDWRKLYDLRYDWN